MRSIRSRRPFRSRSPRDRSEACPESIHKKRPDAKTHRAWKNNPGSDLLSHTVTRAVPSAVEGLTSVFGMGTGVTPLLWPPGNCLPGVSPASPTCEASTGESSQTICKEHASAPATEHPANGSLLPSRRSPKGRQRTFHSINAVACMSTRCIHRPDGEVGRKKDYGQASRLISIG
jgi:hypothetical protein